MQKRRINMVNKRPIIGILGLVMMITISTVSPNDIMTNDDFYYWQQIYADIGDFFQEKSLFIKKFWEKHAEIGAIVPSSSFLSEAMTQHLATCDEPLEILEVGAGTGSFTEYIIKYMPKDSVLHVVEIDHEFCVILKEKFKSNNNVHIHCCSILELELSKKFDCIISGLPFNAFSPDFVQEILEKYNNTFIKPQGTITFFEYAFFPTIKKMLSTTAYSKVLDVLQNFKKNQAHTTEEIVFCNIPPARVITCIANDQFIEQEAS